MLEKELNLDRDGFIKTCLNNKWFKEQHNYYLHCLKEAKDIKEFIKLYLSTEDLTIMSQQAYGELLRWAVFKYSGYSDYLKRILNKADQKHSAYSDIGSLKIGNNSFNFIISNGLGDGKTPVYIFNKNNEMNHVVRNIFKIQTTVRGKFNIYNYDCGNEIMLELDGNYNIYSFNGKIVFIEIDY